MKRLAWALQERLIAGAALDVLQARFTWAHGRRERPLDPAPGERDH